MAAQLNFFASFEIFYLIKAFSVCPLVYDVDYPDREDMFYAENRVKENGLKNLPYIVFRWIVEKFAFLPVNIRIQFFEVFYAVSD